MSNDTESDAMESRILIIMTGGTICMQRSPNGFVPASGFLEACLAPRPSFNDGKAVQKMNVISEKGESRYCVMEFEQLLDSSSIGSAEWEAIAQTIFWNYTMFDGFVILHGTDSLAYTSSALSFMLQNLGKPVILTGSQVPMVELQNDATDNLLGSLIIASHFTIPEVCLFFNYNLFRGNRATKIASADFRAFASPNFPPLATVSAAGTKVSWHLVYKAASLEAMSVQKNFQTAHVACLRIFPGIKAEMIEAVLKVQNLKGLVLETFGSGNIPEGPLTSVLAEAISRGIVIVNVTQCLSGNVSPTYASATILGRAGVVFGHDLTTEAALAKLSYLLGLPDMTPLRVAQQMSMSMRGELTEALKTKFERPVSDQLPTNAATMTVIGHTIAAGDIEGFDEVIKTEGRKLLEQTDYLGNSPLHLAALGPSIAILRELLEHGASVHLRNKSGHTPLYLAAEAGRAEHVRLLREAGAHIHERELVGFKSLGVREEGDGTNREENVWDLALSPTRSH